MTKGFPGHLWRVNRGFVLFAVILYSIFFAANAHATTAHTSDVLKSAALAHCQGAIPPQGEVAPAYGCGLYLVPDAECPAGFLGGFYNHTLSGYHVYCYQEEDSSNSEQCEASRDAATDPESPLFNPETNTQTRTTSSVCKGGCTWAVQGAHSESSQGGALVAVTGHFGFDGSTCSPPPLPEPQEPPPATPPPPTEPACKAAGSGQTFCVTQDGKQCYTASTGRDICWTPGETGSKTDGSTAQQRAGGSTTPSAPTPAPPGDSFSAAGTPVTASTAQVNATGTTTSTTTTTVQNYTTVNGTNAGTTNQGQGTGTTQSGGATTSGSGASGAGQCAAPVTCTGDAVQCAQLTEAHVSACALGELGRDMTTAEEGEIDGDGEGENPGSAEAAGLHEEGGFDTGDLDGSGFLVGSRNCPVVGPVEFYGHQIPMPNETLCMWLSIGAYLILAFAGLAALRIVTGAQ